MRKFFLSFIILFSGCVAFAQQFHFVYIQADNKQPFYVKTNSKLISSSTTGYAIISKLQEGDYNFEIGFPKNDFPPVTITVPVNGDAGYALKNFGEKGWGLFNLQSLQSLLAGKVTQTKNAAQNDNGFANVLADVSNAPELKNPEPKPAVVTNTPKPAPQKEPESVQITKTPTITSKSDVMMISNTFDETGRSLTYTLPVSGKNDTVVVFIPFDKNTKKPKPEKEIKIKQGSEEKITKEETKSAPLNNNGSEKFLDLEIENPNSNSTPKIDTKNQNKKTEITVTPESNAGILTINSDCKAQASEDDFYSLRKKMAAQKDADEMTAQAKKIFKKKCFTTEQIKNLGALYLEETNKYDFYQTAYPYVSDPQIFPSLQNELSSDYLINRFKALIHL